MFFPSVVETPSPSVKSSDDIIDDSDDDTTGSVKRKVCNSTYVTQTTNYVLCYVETVSRVEGSVI